VLGQPEAKIRHRLAQLHEFNPMLGHRGCRLAITYPEIAEMQARAIFEAAVEAGQKTGKPVEPEVMVPLIAVKKEFDMLKERIDRVARDVFREKGSSVAYQVGTMIELPRACLRAGEIAETAEFFSFGTNDLTQTAFGLSRDDAANFLGDYLSKGVIEVDPFISIDQDGVGELVSIGVERGRAVRPNIKLGICGEHGGDPASIAFCDRVGLDYVSCSPYRVPVARLAAAQATLAAKTGQKANKES
jgi:pyruvate,orthophosphate dikinase